MLSEKKASIYKKQASAPLQYTISIFVCKEKIQMLFPAACDRMILNAHPDKTYRLIHPHASKNIRHRLSSDAFARTIRADAPG